MIVYRIARSKWATDLSGQGARLHGGRWNHIGTPCVYSSQNRALAVLEYTVNINVDEIPRALSIVTIEIPENFSERLHPVSISDLPGDWRDSPTPSSTKDFGTRLLQSGLYPIISVPSAIVPQELNYLINPLHGLTTAIRVIEIQDFVYDVRIKRV